MPDRDIVSKRIRSPWLSAGRLWIREGPTPLVVDRFRECLAKALRNGGVEVERARAEARLAGVNLDVEELERLACRLLVERAVLAPLRDHRLIAGDAASAHAEEQALLDALRPDITRYAAQVLAGDRPRVRRRARGDVRRILNARIPVQL
jgi:hypothetical protein